MMERKIAFFDIDGTITSEVDGSIPASAVQAIRQAKANGHLLFINTGRCLETVDKRILDIGFNGIICACGSDIYCDGKEVLYVHQTREITEEILAAARDTDTDLLLEARDFDCFVLPLRTKVMSSVYHMMLDQGYVMPKTADDPDLIMDKFCMCCEDAEKQAHFFETACKYFVPIDRGHFYEFIPKGYTKATGIDVILSYYNMPLSEAYAFGDSNNDLAMLDHVGRSVVMGNAKPASLKDHAWFVAGKSSEDGMAKALKELGFI